jgi:predicted AlkP superfamily phosphohydrolase/phosphomutase
LRVYRLFSSFVLERVSTDTRTALMRSLPHKTAEYYQIDWSKTLAYCLPYGPFSWQGVWVNVQGKKPQGIVAPGKEYEQLRELLVQRLGELQDPSNWSNEYSRKKMYTQALIQITLQICW